MDTRVLMIIIIVFTLSNIVLMVNIPDELLATYQDPSINIPDEFRAWSVLTRDIYITNVLNESHPTNFQREYDFTSQVNETLKFMVRFAIDGSGLVVSELWTHIIIDLFEDMEPDPITRNMLISNWNSVDNASLIYVRNEKRLLPVYFQDYNSLRNNIGSAYDDGLVNCTITLAGTQDYTERITAREMIFALLTFRLPLIFSSVNPILLQLLSVMFYVPLSIMAYIVFIDILHGGGGG